MKPFTAMQPDAFLCILYYVCGGLIDKFGKLPLRIVGDNRLHGRKVDDVRSSFRYDPKSLKTVFVDIAYKIAFEFAMRSTWGKVDKLISVVSGKPAASHGYPEESPTVFVDIINEVVRQSLIHRDIGYVIPVGKIFLCPERRDTYYGIYNKV